MLRYTGTPFDMQLCVIDQPETRSSASYLVLIAHQPSLRELFGSIDQEG